MRVSLTQRPLGEKTMKTVAQMQQAILELPENDYNRLSRWFHERDWEQWDAEIEADSQAGKLDFLSKQSLQAKSVGTLREL